MLDFYQMCIFIIHLRKLFLMDDRTLYILGGGSYDNFSTQDDDVLKTSGKLERDQ